MIVIKQLMKKYKEKEILFHINEYIFNDGIYEVKGKSGSGKTTLLKILAGIEKQSGGCVDIDNYTSIFLPNEGLLINNLSFNENINFYSSLIKDAEFFKESLDKLITKFGLHDLLDQKVKNLSKITEPELPEREGYELEGWYYNDQKWSFVGYVVTEDMELVANGLKLMCLLDCFIIRFMVIVMLIQQKVKLVKL